MRPLRSLAAFTLTSTPAPAAAPASAYVHLPFCKRKCLYCDFAVVALGRAAAPASQTRAYVDALVREIRATPEPLRAPLATLYFGGGTPSLLPEGQLAEVLGALEATLGLQPGAEVTLEADPGTFDRARLQAYLRLGVTRFSVGVQAFQQELLQLCGRSHSLAEVGEALRDVRAVGPPSWSLDLMCGLPTQTLPQWEASLHAAIAAQPDHVSVYDLQAGGLTLQMQAVYGLVEPGTPFGQRYTPGAGPLPSHEDSAEMLALAARTLVECGGYEHYELSNYARPGHRRIDLVYRRSRHNMAYWSGTAPYHAFGLGAASFLGGRRFSRPRSMAAYYRWAEEGFPTGGGEEEDEQEQLLSLVMLRLRLRDGLDLGQVGARFGAPAAAAIQEALRPHRAWGSVCEAGEGVVRLTEAGLLVCNDVISDVFARVLEAPKPRRGRRVHQPAA